MRTATPFDAPAYAELTSARIGHLRALALPYEGKRVLDLGSGVGRIAEFFLERGCDVTCVDGRAENIATLRHDYPGTKAHVLDLELDELAPLGTFDIVLCYGIFGLLSDPLAFLRRVRSVTEGFALIETAIVDGTQAWVKLVHQNAGDPTSALYGIGSRPTSTFLKLALQIAEFGHIYGTAPIPDHPAFHFQRVNDYQDWRDGREMREVIVASVVPLIADTLTPR